MPVSVTASLLADLVSAITIHPRLAQVTVLAGAKILAFEVACHPDDLGRLIGREGRTVCAMASLLYAACQEEHRRILLEVFAATPDRGNRRRDATSVVQTAYVSAAMP